MLWVDKYRPKQLETLDYHQDQAVQLQNLAKNGDFPHLLVYGPLGSGRKTRINCFLRQLYGASVDKLKVDNLTFTTPSNKKLEITSLASNYHIEIRPADVGIYDRVVVMGVIKSVAQTHQLNVTGAQHKDFKVIVIVDADQLSRDAQHALRRTMEKCASSCRLILYATAASAIIAPVRSRCLGVRIAAPTHAQIATILVEICNKENVTLPAALAERIAQTAERNLRRAILMCEACHVQEMAQSAGQLKVDTKIPPPDWQVYIRSEIVRPMLAAQTPAVLLRMRQAFYELLQNGIPTEDIFICCIRGLIEKCDADMVGKFVETAATYQYRSILGSKDVIHLEAFASQCMGIYQRVMRDFMDVDF